MLVYFWKDITRIIGAWFRHVTRRGLPANDPDVRMGWLIIIGTVPIVIIGFLAQEYIRSAFRSLWLVAIVLIVLAYSWSASREAKYSVNASSQSGGV